MVLQFSENHCIPVYFTYFESIIAYRSTRRAGYCLKRLKTSAFRRSELLDLLRLMGMSAPALHREFNDPLMHVRL